MLRENLKRTDLLQKAKQGDTISNQNRNSYKKSYKEDFGASANNLKNIREAKKTKRAETKKITPVKTKSKPIVKEEMASIPVTPEAVNEPEFVVPRPAETIDEDVFGISGQEPIELEPLRGNIFSAEQNNTSAENMEITENVKDLIYTELDKLKEHSIDGKINNLKIREFLEGNFSRKEIIEKINKIIEDKNKEVKIWGDYGLTDKQNLYLQEIGYYENIINILKTVEPKEKTFRPSEGAKDAPEQLVSEIISQNEQQINTPEDEEQIEFEKLNLKRRNKVKVKRSQDKGGVVEDDWEYISYNKETKEVTVIRKDQKPRYISLKKFLDTQKMEVTEKAPSINIEVPASAPATPEPMVLEPSLTSEGEKIFGQKEHPQTIPQKDEINVEESLVLARERREKLAKLIKSKTQQKTTEEENKNLQQERGRLERAAEDARNNIPIIKSEIRELREKIEIKNKEADEYADKIEGVNKDGEKTILGSSVLFIKQFFSLGNFKKSLQKKVTQLDEEVNFLNRKLKEKEAELRKEEDKINRLEAFDIKHKK